MFRKYVKPSKWAIRGAMVKNPTPAERALRRSLNRLAAPTGFRFHFQRIMAGYILDFFCPSVRVAVEVDGSSHDKRRAHDRERDAFCRDQFKILTLRFTNEQVLADPDRTAEKIIAFCQTRTRFRSWNAGLTYQRKSS